MNIIETLKADYARFPENQTYSIYADNVYFQDAVFKFRGLELYKWMIKFIQTFFLNLKLDLHNIQSQEKTIKTESHRIFYIEVIHQINVAFYILLNSLK